MPKHRVGLLRMGGERWGVKASAKKPRVLQHFLRWYHATQKLLAEWSSGCLGIFGHHGLDSRFHVTYQWQHLDLLVGRLQWISPIHRQIDGIFAAKPLYVQPDIRFFNHPVTSEFRTLRASFPPNGSDRFHQASTPKLQSTA